MKKRCISIISLMLSAILLCALGVPAFAGSSYTIESPYKDVVWGQTPVFKGNLHTHSTISDADEPMDKILTEHYEQGFDFVAMTDHGITGRAWNEKPYMWVLYAYQEIAGNKRSWLTDEQYYGMTNGTYPLSSGVARGKKMTCVTGGNELNGLTASKSHVNGFFLPENSCNANVGFENGYEYAVRLADKNGGMSHINHPGDWLASSGNIGAVYDKENLELFRNIFLKYDSCLGMEVFNGNNNTTPYDRILWDNLLMETLPYGRSIIGFSNSDTHNAGMVDSSFSVFLMNENTVESIKETMQSGSFFCVTRKMRENDVIGPAKSFDYINKKLPYPMFTNLTVNDHTVTVNAENTKYIQWIANGKVIFEQDITSANQTVTLNLDSITGSESFLYIRAELYGDGGMCASQALTIDDGSAPLEYKEDTSIKAIINKILYILKSTRFVVITMELINAIKDD